MEQIGLQSRQFAPTLRVHFEGEFKNSDLEWPASPMHGGLDRPTEFSLRRLDLYLEQISQYTLWILPFLFALFYVSFVSNKDIIFQNMTLPIEYLQLITAVSLLFLVFHLGDLMNQVAQDLVVPFFAPSDTDEQRLDNIVTFTLLTRAVRSYPGALNPLFPAVQNFGAHNVISRGLTWVWLRWLRFFGTQTGRMTLFVLFFAATYGLLIATLGGSDPVARLQDIIEGPETRRDWVIAGNMFLAVLAFIQLFSLMGSLARLVSFMKLGDASDRYLILRSKNRKPDEVNRFVDRSIVPLINAAVGGYALRMKITFLLIVLLLFVVSHRFSVPAGEAIISELFEATARNSVAFVREFFGGR